MTAPAAVRAATYARVSRPDEGPILENQRLALRQYCEARRFQLAPADEYYDIASGATSDRPGFGLLMERASHPRLRTFDLVIFTSLSRMTRGGIAAALDTLRVLEREGVSWHFIDQSALNYDSNTPKFSKDVILAVLAAVDEEYRRNISQKTKAAAARKRALATAAGVRFVWGRPRKRVPPETAATGAASEIAPISRPPIALPHSKPSVENPPRGRVAGPQGGG